MSAVNIYLVAGGGIAPPTPGEDPDKLLLLYPAISHIKRHRKLTNSKGGIKNDYVDAALSGNHPFGKASYCR